MWTIWPLPEVLQTGKLTNNTPPHTHIHRSKCLCPSVVQISIRCGKTRNGDTYTETLPNRENIQTLQRQLSTETSHTDIFHSVQHVDLQIPHTETSLGTSCCSTDSQTETQHRFQRFFRNLTANLLRLPRGAFHTDLTQRQHSETSHGFRETLHRKLIEKLY